jgi:hypothetical protein
MVEPRIVVPAVAGSSPVGHPNHAAVSEERDARYAPEVQTAPRAKISRRVVKTSEECENPVFEDLGTSFLLLKNSQIVEDPPELIQKTKKRLYE